MFPLFIIALKISHFRCVPGTSRCSGNPECEDGSDELEWEHDDDQKIIWSSYDKIMINWSLRLWWSWWWWWMIMEVWTWHKYDVLEDAKSINWRQVDNHKQLGWRLFYQWKTNKINDTKMMPLKVRRARNWRVRRTLWSWRALPHSWASKDNWVMITIILTRLTLEQEMITKW